MAENTRILIIKLGALGDFIQAVGPFLAIRRFHPKAHITLLTTDPFETLAIESGLFQEIWIDNKPRIWDIKNWLLLRKKMLKGRFSRIYDLQTSTRSSLYFELLRPGVRPEWSGIALNCSHPHFNNQRDLMHTVDRQSEQLAITGINNVPLSELSWVKADLSIFELPKNYALIAPGGARHRPSKRWPANFFGQLVTALKAKKICSVIVGTNSDIDTVAPLLKSCSKAVNLCGKTNLSQLCVLARDACFAVGNDTGPMHIAATIGISSVVLYSNASNPNLCAPRGLDVRVLQKPNISDISVEEVLTALKGTLSF
ncbi:MAG: hypothetical protein CFH06_00068 [Alphaproteobacteria bacterium MarineAlpha3_Bin5]|nr:ADP-heptose--LPS heptosyltransferase [Magnetovibrio sp.]PPR80123.1 MAG: hypothetical protein CFH06_00068 [Alphaproteobacteria bacterium MarineAlpha3_Bin5]